MSWYKILLPYETAIEHQGKIMLSFTQACMANATVKDAALFADRDLGDPYALYFSPASVSICSAILAHYSGVPCEKPDASSVKLMAGRSNSWNLLKG